MTTSRISEDKWYDPATVIDLAFMRKVRDEFVRCGFSHFCLSHDTFWYVWQAEESDVPPKVSVVVESLSYEDRERLCNALKRSTGCSRSPESPRVSVPSGLLNDLFEYMRARCGQLQTS